MRVEIAVLIGLYFVSAAGAEISEQTFRHHFIAKEVPARNVGMGSPALADFDRDGDLDFAFLNRGDKRLYWYEQRSADEWVQHPVGKAGLAQLGSVTMDVDADGWMDLVIGGSWYRNPGQPRAKAFIRYDYDHNIMKEIHDIVAADVDGDGRDDLVVTGDGDGCFWYSIPEDPTAGAEWPRTTITFAVRDDNADIHSGLSSHGVADLDGDGDRDVMLTNRWYENTEGGQRWLERRLLFGKIGPWGASSRSWITDLDGDGDNDVVVVDSDGQNSGVAWIENRDGRMRNHWVHWLANRAPGTRGSFHSLQMADFDLDGDADILVVEQEDSKILPQGAGPRWFIWENRTEGNAVEFVERVVFDGRLGGHDVLVGDVDGDGDIDVASKVWNVWKDSANGGQAHADWLENLAK